MVYAKIHEKHGWQDQGVFWKKYKSKEAARKEIENWNSFDNPSEKLTLLTISNERPKGIRKTKYKGIYREVQPKNFGFNW